MRKTAKKTAPKKPEPKAKPVGRPGSYRPQFAAQAAKLCELGATDKDVADFFQVSIVTIWRWRSQFAEFSSALKAGKVTADDRTEMSLYHRANGYSFESEKVFCHQGEVIRVPVIEHVPPDTTACIFWLKNRRPEVWRDKREVETNVTLSLADLVTMSYREDLPALPDPKVIEHEE